MKISKADCPEMIKDTTPVQDGFFMPGEFEQHQGCIMIWPERPGSWRNGAKEAETAFSAVIRAIAASETVYVAAGDCPCKSICGKSEKRRKLTSGGCL